MIRVPPSTTSSNHWRTHAPQQAQAQQIGYYVGVLFGATLMGAICGCLPLYLGRSRERRGLGKVGFVMCILAGFVLGLLGALPVAVVFALVILAMGRPAQKRKASDAPKYRTPTPGPVDF